MHDVAEYGMPAHWAYKDEQQTFLTTRLSTSEDVATQSRSVEWLESIKAKDRSHGTNPIQFVHDVLREELGKRCFVFLRNGRILNLTRGCTALDAAFKINKQIGFRMLYPEVNGTRVELSYKLHNGDCVNIITAPDAVPSWEWFKHAFLSSTQSALISYFRRRQQNRRNQQNMVNFAGAAATFALAWSVWLACWMLSQKALPSLKAFHIDEPSCCLYAI